MVNETKNPQNYVSKIDEIELNLTAGAVCANFNRVCILYLLHKSPKKEMQAEKIASMLGISHRTTLYHLDVLKDYELVEVREFRKRGEKLLRSVWGLKSENYDKIRKILCKINKIIDKKEIESVLKFCMANELNKKCRKTSSSNKIRVG